MKIKVIKIFLVLLFSLFLITGSYKNIINVNNANNNYNYNGKLEFFGNLRNNKNNNKIEIKKVGIIESIINCIINFFIEYVEYSKIHPFISFVAIFTIIFFTLFYIYFCYVCHHNPEVRRDVIECERCLYSFFCLFPKYLLTRCCGIEFDDEDGEIIDYILYPEEYERELERVERAEREEIEFRKAVKEFKKIREEEERKMKEEEDSKEREKVKIKKNLKTFGGIRFGKYKIEGEVQVYEDENDIRCVDVKINPDNESDELSDNEEPERHSPEESKKIIEKIEKRRVHQFDGFKKSTNRYFIKTQKDYKKAFGKKYKYIDPLSSEEEKEEEEL